MASIKQSILKKLYLTYLQHQNPTKTYIKNIQTFIFPQQIKSIPIILLDLYMFWYPNFKAIKYIQLLFLKYKYNPRLQEFTIPRYNILWALKRNFFIPNIAKLYKPKVPTHCIKYYIILKQYLDDKLDYNIDTQQKQITPFTQQTIFITPHKFKQFILKYAQTLYTKSPTNSTKSIKICQIILNFHVQFV